jgi:hypothetical protein
MKRLTVRFAGVDGRPDRAESRARRMSKSDVVRERLSIPSTTRPTTLEAIQDLIGAVDTARSDISSNKKLKPKTMRYGGKRPR